MFSYSSAVLDHSSAFELTLSTLYTFLVLYLGDSPTTPLVFNH